ncbi:MAG: pantoate--beta-alanine ligase [Roseiflexaceae bacterium]|nr:pantoate--beta-alanine ligase [Roseiflexaceae bacterium]
MHTTTTIRDFRAARAGLDTLGFVPTMGFLHEGHLSLVRQAKRECGTAAVSIFVNPAQFGPNEDLARYPRDLNHDLALLGEAGADLVFMPGVEEIYPPGYRTYVTVEGLTERLESAIRPGHFRGVATVVCKLLNIVQAEKAYFGQKDAQQCMVIDQMARDLAIPTAIVIAPTVREPDGLAMSSRNVYLSPEDRRAATVLIRALHAAEQAHNAGERDAERLREIVRGVLASEPRGQPDYVSCADPLTLQELDAVGQQGALLSLAVRFGTTRLLDKALLGGIQPSALSPQPSALSL